MKIDMEHLQKNTKYQVKVRAIPQEEYLQGTWSEWSETFSFVTPAGKWKSASLKTDDDDGII